MLHRIKPYYLLITISVLLGSILSYTQTSDRSPGILLFNTALYSLFIGLGLLYMDYVFTILNKHQYMRYFYVLFILMIFYYIPPPLPVIAKPILSLVSFIAVILFTIIVLITNVYFYIRISRLAKEEGEIQQAEHAIHIFSKAYERHKESKDPLEIQVYDFFASKFGNLSKKDAPIEEEKVSI
jgi:hypothetical protein